MDDGTHSGGATRSFGEDPPLSDCPEPIAIVGMGKQHQLIAEQRMTLCRCRLPLARRGIRPFEALELVSRRKKWLYRIQTRHAQP